MEGSFSIPFTQMAAYLSALIFFMKAVFHSAPLPFTLQEIDFREEPRRVLLCSPSHFDIVDEKNVHMAGQVGKVNKEAVSQQWQELRSVYEDLRSKGILDEVAVMEGAAACEDMVFCANQTFPWQTASGEKIVVMSNMRHPSRQKEVPYFELFFLEKGFTPKHFSGEVYFEGMGDVIPHPGKRLVYGGYGHRTSAAAYDELAVMLDAPVLALELVSPHFYHLDTCFVPLSATSVMLCKEAFSDVGLEMLKAMFETIHFIPLEEASTLFSLNAHVLLLKQKVAILQKGSMVTLGVLQQEGFEVIEIETSEFMKSGGSVFCMKMMFP